MWIWNSRSSFFHFFFPSLILFVSCLLLFFLLTYYFLMLFLSLFYFLILCCCFCCLFDFVDFLFCFVLFCSVSACTIVCTTWSRLSLTSNQPEGQAYPWTWQQPSRTNYNRTVHITHTSVLPIVPSSGDEGDCIHWVPRDTYYRRSPHEVWESEQSFLTHRHKHRTAKMERQSNRPQMTE